MYVGTIFVFSNDLKVEVMAAELLTSITTPLIISGLLSYKNVKHIINNITNSKHILLLLPEYQLPKNLYTQHTHQDKTVNVSNRRFKWYETYLHEYNTTKYITFSLLISYFVPLI